MMKLDIGAGTIRHPGWTTVDLDNADISVDITKQNLPVPNASVDFIFNEHFFEHVTYEDGQRVLQEFKRVLKPGGVLRIGTPDLDYVVDKYIKDWKDQDWLKWPAYKSRVKTKCQMINMAFRHWGHQHLYNEEEMVRALIQAGFINHKRVEWGISLHTDLNGLETRKDTLLIIETIK